MDPVPASAENARLLDVRPWGADTTQNAASPPIRPGCRLAGLAIGPVGKGESVRLWQELQPGTPVVALNATVEGTAGVSRVYPGNAAGVDWACAASPNSGIPCGVDRVFEGAAATR
jgi:hypothetical protein